MRAWPPAWCGGGGGGAGGGGPEPRVCLLGTSLIKANKELTYDAIVARSKNSLRIIFCILRKVLVVVQKAKLNHVRLYLRRRTGAEDSFFSSSCSCFATTTFVFVFPRRRRLQDVKN